MKCSAALRTMHKIEQQLDQLSCLPSSNPLTEARIALRDGLKNAAKITDLDPNKIEMKRLQRGVAGQYALKTKKITLDTNTALSGDLNLITHVATHEGFHALNRVKARKRGEADISCIKVEEALTEINTGIELAGLKC